MSAAWWAVLIASAGCYALKFLGLAVPPGLLERRWVDETLRLLPIALLAALIAVQSFATGYRLVLDARAAGFVAAVVAVLCRAPFVVVVLAAVATAAGVRLLW